MHRCPALWAEKLHSLDRVWAPEAHLERHQLQQSVHRISRDIQSTAHNQEALPGGKTCSEWRKLSLAAPTDTSYGWSELEEHCASSCSGHICPDLWGVPQHPIRPLETPGSSPPLLQPTPTRESTGAWVTHDPFIPSDSRGIHCYGMRYGSEYSPKSFLDPSTDLLAKNMPSVFKTSHLPPQPPVAPSSRLSLSAQWSCTFLCLHPMNYTLVSLTPSTLSTKR